MSVQHHHFRRKRGCSDRGRDRHGLLGVPRLQAQEDPQRARRVEANPTQVIRRDSKWANHAEKIRVTLSKHKIGRIQWVFVGSGLSVLFIYRQFDRGQLLTSIWSWLNEHLSFSRRVLGACKNYCPDRCTEKENERSIIAVAAKNYSQNGLFSACFETERDRWSCSRWYGQLRHNQIHVEWHKARESPGRRGCVRVSPPPQALLHRQLPGPQRIQTAQTQTARESWSHHRGQTHPLLSVWKSFQRLWSTWRYTRKKVFSKTGHETRKVLWVHCIGLLAPIVLSF